MRYLSIETIVEDVYITHRCMSCSDKLIAVLCIDNTINFYNIYNIKLSHKYLCEDL